MFEAKAASLALLMIGWLYLSVYDQQFMSQQDQCNSNNFIFANNGRLRQGI
jgi:hypothetical protein